MWASRADWVIYLLHDKLLAFARNNQSAVSIGSKNDDLEVCSKFAGWAKPEDEPGLLNNPGKVRAGIGGISWT